MKIRSGFVSNSSTSSFVLTHWSDWGNILYKYEFSAGDGSGGGYDLPKEVENIWDSIFAELGRESPGQNEVDAMTTKEIPVVWDTLEYNIRHYGRLILKVPLEFLDMRTIMKHAPQFFDEIKEAMKDEYS